jgi:hypothetical protein
VALFSEPWEGKTNAEVVAAVLNGLRLPIPANCPPTLSEIITVCWEVDPDNRPLFRELLTGLLDFSKTLSGNKTIDVDFDELEK